jgi:hypothetical protein
MRGFRLHAWVQVVAMRIWCFVNQESYGHDTVCLRLLQAAMGLVVFRRPSTTRNFLVDARLGYVDD